MMDFSAAENMDDGPLAIAGFAITCALVVASACLMINKGAYQETLSKMDPQTSFAFTSPEICTAHKLPGISEKALPETCSFALFNASLLAILPGSRLYYDTMAECEAAHGPNVCTKNKIPLLDDLTDGFHPPVIGYLMSKDAKKDAPLYPSRIPHMAMRADGQLVRLETIFPNSLSAPAPL